MTVCIAAKFNNGKAVVLAADQMATMANVVRESESAHKILPLNNNMYVMISGDSILAREIHKASEPRCAQITTVADAAAVVQEEFINTRLGRAENVILNPRGLTFASYQASMRGMDPNIVALIDQQLSQFQIDAGLLVAGIDEDGTAKIYAVEGGLKGELDDFAAVGSGTSHAVNSLHARNYNSEANKDMAIYLTLEAKKRSEVAPGVGIKTDMIVIESKGTTTLSDEDIAGLKDQYESIMKRENELLEEEVGGKKVEAKANVGK